MGSLKFSETRRTKIGDGRYIVPEKPRGSIIDDEEIKAVVEVLKGEDSLSYAGKNIPAFEEEFAKYCGVKHAIAVANCTVALYIAAQILRLKKDDEVIMTPLTFKATALPMVIRGCKVVFADIDRTLNIDPSTIEKKITNKTKAIFVTHMNGNPVDMDPVMEIAKKYGIKVVEDAAHAPGAEYKGRKVGSLGDITCFSFHSLKNMTTGGEGGMITTNDDKFAAEARALKSMGILGTIEKRQTTAFGNYNMPDFPVKDHSDGAYEFKFTHIEEVGLNYRMSDLQAAIGRVQLKKLDKLNERRIALAKRYSEGISKIKGFKLWEPTPNSKCVYHLYPVFIDTSVIKAGRDAVIKLLEEKYGIEIIQRFFPVHLSRYMQAAGHKFGECPVCEKIFFEEQINLPISPSMPVEEVDYVIESLKGVAKHFGGGEK